MSRMQPRRITDAEGESPTLAAYLVRLDRALTLRPAERDAVLEEVGAHLWDATTALEAAGLDRLDAERTAAARFGQPSAVARRISRGFPRPFGVRRHVAVAVLGGFVAWAVWTLGTFPILAHSVLEDGPQYGYDYEMRSGNLGIHVLAQAAPTGQGAFYAFQVAGLGWLTALVTIFLAPAVFCGLRARRPWLVGLAYGVGATLAMPWYWGYTFISWGSGSWPYHAQGRVVLLAAALAVVAAACGSAAMRFQPWWARFIPVRFAGI